VVSDETYGEVLGIHIIGPLATELLAEAATVLNLEGTIDDMMNMMHAHPTVWEAMGDAFASVRDCRLTFDILLVGAQHAAPLQRNWACVE